MAQATVDETASMSKKYPVYDISDGPKVINIWTAAQFGDKKYLLTVLEKSHDVDVNCVDNVGRSPLHWAVSHVWGVDAMLSSCQATASKLCLCCTYSGPTRAVDKFVCTATAGVCFVGGKFSSRNRADIA